MNHCPTFLPKSALAVAAAFLAALILSAAPRAMAQNVAPSEGKAAKAESAAPGKHMESLDGHIANLHKQLGITADQETEWKNLARAMQDNTAALQAVYDKWKPSSGEFNALDNLKFHADIAGAQAQAMQKLVAAFEALYNKMSDAQKKNADAVFSYRHHEKMPGKMKGKEKHDTTDE